MKKIYKALKLFTIAITLIFAFIACDKDFNTLGSDIIGAPNFNTTSQKFSALSYNKKLNPVQTNGLPANLLGVYNDPIYGETVASIVTQITPNTFAPTFGEEAAIDSVVLYIPYFSKTSVDSPDEDGNTLYTISDSLYGNQEATINLSIYKNNYFLRDFDPDSEFDDPQKYFSNSNATINFNSHTGELLYSNNEFVFSEDPVVLFTKNDDDVNEESERLAPGFRTRLDDPYNGDAEKDNPLVHQSPDFWKALILDKEGQTELSNSNNFKDYFRGLYFQAQAVSSDGSMIMLNPGTNEANITIFYSSKSTTNEDERVQSTYVLNFTENRVNILENNYSTTLTDGDAINGDEKLYLKGGEGSMAIINLFEGTIEDPVTGEILPQLDYFKERDGDWLINEANLVFYEDESVATTEDDDKFHDIDRLFIYDAKNNTPIVDYFADPSDNGGDPLNSKIIHLGKREKDENGAARFKIRITEHVRNLLRDSTNTRLGLVLSNNINSFQNSSVLDSDDDIVTELPSASVISPRGTILYGSNVTVPENKRVELEVFYTCSNESDYCPE